MTNKERYREFCKTESDIPIFSKDWWLDSVCGEKNWDVSIVEKGGEIVASLPYFIVKKGVFNVITMPKLTQNLGPYIKYPKGQKYYKKLSWEKDMMESLIEQLPRNDLFVQNFSYKVTNWLPFYWRSFSQTTKYTYIVQKDNSEEIEKVLLTESRRRRIKKARKHNIEIIESNDVKSFYELNKKTFKRQGVSISYNFEFVERLFNTCMNNDSVKIYFAIFEDEIIATSFLVYDDTTVYYLMGGIEPEKTDLGAMDLIQLEGIKFALDSGRIFDFEGSMIESIEKYFRSFGAEQKTYFTISKKSSKILKLKDLIKEIIR